jgi:signal transduction histidine kinase
MGDWIAKKKLPLFWIGIVTGMALLWVIVAVLQYRWASQLSAATEGRIGSNLQSLMTRWQRDLYDELSAICIALQVGPDSGAHDAWNDYLQRYAEWNQDAARSEGAEGAYPNPDLVREIYDWQTSGPGKAKLLRLNPKAKTLDTVIVPRDLEMLFVRLQENSSNLRAAMRAWEFGTSSENESEARNHGVGTASLRTNALAGWQLDEGIPALVHPVVHHADPFNSQTLVDRARVDWLVVVLDSRVIRNRILPELASRHFGGPEGLEYELVVVASDDKPRIIYSSDSTIRIDDVGSFDSVMNIFGPSSNNIKGEFWQAVKHSPNLSGQDWRNFSAPGWFPVFQYGPDDEPWALILRHRTGPVTTIAKSMWHRDLLTGGIALFLLAIGMFLIIFASQRAHRLAKLRLDFVGSVSHELLTPLAAIYCSGENVRDGLAQTKTASVEQGSIITGQARQLIDLVKQILLFASTENGMNPYTFRPLQVLGILEDVRKNVAVLVEGTGFTVEQHVQEGLPHVMGDLSALSHCLQNLIVNAVKYSGGNRWVGISASVHPAGRHHREVWISVKDHGSGIGSSDLPHIFEPFYRSAKVVDAQIHGTGLGLAVAKRLAEGMRGRLSVTSEVDVGSTFTLHLPVNPDVAY